MTEEEQGYIRWGDLIHDAHSWVTQEDGTQKQVWYKKLVTPGEWPVKTIPRGANNGFREADIREIEIGTESDAEYAYFTHFPDDLAEWDMIEKLSICSSYLKELPATVFEMPNLKELHLYNCVFAKLPEIPENHSIELLEINNFQLDGLSESLSNLRELKRLVISEQKWKVIPDPIYNLPKLKKLQLFCKEIESMSSDIGNLQHLEELEIYDSKIQSFPIPSKVMKNLRIILIERSRIWNIAGIQWAPNLEKLTISSDLTHLKRINHTDYLKIYKKMKQNPLQFPKNLSKLSELSLSGCYLPEIHSFICSYSSLVKIVLIGSEIRYIPSCLWEINSLRHIEIRGGFFEDINFSHTSNIYDYIDLSYNKIKKLPISLIENTKDFHIDNNPCYDQYLALKRLENS